MSELSFAVDEFVPLSALTDAQRATLGAVGALIEPAKVSVYRTTVARGLTPMPEGVFTLSRRDGFQHTAYLHPDGSLRLNYSPASR